MPDPPVDARPPTALVPVPSAEVLALGEEVKALSQGLDVALRRLGTRLGMDLKTLEQRSREELSAAQRAAVMEALGAAGAMIIDVFAVVGGILIFRPEIMIVLDLDGSRRRMLKDLETSRRMNVLMEGHLETLVEFAARTLKTQEQVLEVLLHSRTTEARQLIQQAWENLQAGYEEDARLRLEKSLDFDNTVAMAHAELGRIYASRGEDPKAEDHFERAVKFSPGEGREIECFARRQQAVFLRDRGRAAEAVEALLITPADLDKSPELWLALAECQAAVGRDREALDSVSHAAARDESLASAARGSKPLARLRAEIVVVILKAEVLRRTRLVADLEALAGLAGTDPGGPSAVRRDLTAALVGLVERLPTTDRLGLAGLEAEVKALAASGAKALVVAARTELAETRGSLRSEQEFPPGLATAIPWPIWLGIPVFASQVLAYLDHEWPFHLVVLGAALVAGVLYGLLRRPGLRRAWEERVAGSSARVRELEGMLQVPDGASHTPLVREAISTALAENLPAVRDADSSGQGTVECGSCKVRVQVPENHAGWSCPNCRAQLA